MEKIFTHATLSLFDIMSQDYHLSDKRTKNVATFYSYTIVQYSVYWLSFLIYRPRPHWLALPAYPIVVILNGLVWGIVAMFVGSKWAMRKVILWYGKFVIAT